MTLLPERRRRQQAGFRACKRCRPDASPGSPEWNARADFVARAMRLIADGVVDREGVPGLAARLGYSARQIERQLLAELGAGRSPWPGPSAPRPRALLIETTALPMADVAFAAGFASDPHVQRHRARGLRARPGELRDRAAAEAGTRPTPRESSSLRLPYRAPLNPGNLFGHLAATAVPGVEEWRDGAYRRTLRLPHGHGIVALAPRPDHIACRLSLTDPRDLTRAISRCRRLLDLDADPVAVDEQLRSDPLLAPLVDKAPGRRVPRTVDAAEFAVRAVLGQQVSTAAARTHAARLVTAHGEPVEDPEGGLTHLFPTPEALAGLDPEALALPRSRRTTLTTLVAALADGSLDLGVGTDWDAGRGPSCRPARLRPLDRRDRSPCARSATRTPSSPPTWASARGRGLGLPATPAALTARAAAGGPGARTPCSTCGPPTTTPSTTCPPERRQETIMTPR